MRKFRLKYWILILTVLTILSITSCDQSTRVYLSPQARTLQGTWEWVYWGGHGFCPWATPESAGYRITVVFTPDSFYQILMNDTILRLDTRYWIVEDRDSNGVIEYTSGVRGSPIYSAYRFIEPDTLVLQELVLDACTEWYKRK